MLKNVKLCQYGAPTPIQSYCIPAILTGNDVVAIAQTGKYRRHCVTRNITDSAQDLERLLHS